LRTLAAEAPLTNNGLSSPEIEVRLTVDGTKCTFIA